MKDMTEFEGKSLDAWIKIGKGIARKYGYGVDADELESIVNFSLTRALVTYDPGKGFKFTTYLGFIIRNKIFNYKRDMKKSVDVQFSLDESRTLFDATNRTLGDTVPSSLNIDDMIESKICLEHLRDKFTEKEWKSILLRHVDGLTQTEISKIVDIKQVQVSRLLRSVKSRSERYLKI